MRYTELLEATVHGKTFYAACKKAYGGRAFDKGLTKDEIKTVEKSLGIDRLPAYLASAPTIDGYVVVIPPNHPDWKTRFGDKGVPTPAPAVTPTKPKEDQSPKALEELQSMMRSAERNQWAEWRRVQKTDQGWEFEVRDWGHWQNPPDAEDEEDYDWQVLSYDSKSKLQGMVSDVSKRYPDLDIYFTTEEKNWIVCVAQPKA